jgi:hypothetical protein
MLGFLNFTAGKFFFANNALTGFSGFGQFENNTNDWRSERSRRQKVINLFLKFQQKIRPIVTAFYSAVFFASALL